MRIRQAALFVCLGTAAFAQDYDLVIKNGHVIDGKNHLSAVRDVAMKDGKIAAVAADIPASRALKTVDATGLYVTPGLIDIHVHVFPGLKHATYDGGDWGVYPDGFTFRAGVTTVADAGSSGWRSFEDFKKRIIDTQKTRVLAFLNIVGVGMQEGGGEQNLKDMEVQPAIDTVNRYKGLIVGIKSAHFTGPEWTPYINAEEIGKATHIPVMVDFGSNVRAGRTLYDLLNKYFRPGDIYTHCYGGNRGEQDPETKGPSKAMVDGRARGVIFDVGHGGGSFRWSCAIPLMKAGFIPDSISTDLHASSMNSGMKDMLNVMDKFLAMGMSLDEVILRSTWNPAREIQHEELGNLSVGSPADVAVLRLEKGKFGLTDQIGARFDGNQRLVAELTLRDGKVVWDLNGISRETWDKIPPGGRGGDPRWDSFTPAGRGGAGRGGDQKKQ
ncbi:MAG: amidohydrolase/deacetylase family metallohydrolase [Proteobacteria bacterium]|nr:MAG: amidohydrolase/deacetylase family metallohydrolase [Pseudomonadota bacterium]